MKLSDIRISGKLFIGFAIVLAIMTSAAVYQIMNMQRLASIQDEGAGRAEDALKIKDASARVDEVYTMVADSIINNNLQDVYGYVETAKSNYAKDTAQVKKLADTDEEIQLAEEFAASYARYVGMFEKQLLPILERRESIIQRSRDSAAINEISLRVNEIYAIAADAIINQNYKDAEREFGEIEQKAQSDIQKVYSLADTDAERRDATDFERNYRGYLAFIDGKVFPAVEAKAQMAKLRELDDETDRHRGSVLSIIGKIRESLGKEAEASAEDEEKIRTIDEQIDASRDQTRTKLDAIVASLVAENSKADAEYDAINKSSVSTAIAVTIAGIILAIILAALITRSITTPINRAVEVANSLARGDLSVRIEAAGKDETGQLLAAMRQMVANLRNIVSQTITASNQVAVASNQLSEANTSFSERVTQQAAAVEETTSAMEETSQTIEEMSATIKQTAENTSEMNKLVQATRQQSEDGNRIMTDTIGAMSEISRSSDKIANISNVIEEIAFQTNLLALNAAVEAARAGEHGKGFAVVASEIRALAQRTTESAKEINELISESLDKTNRGVSLAEGSSRMLGEIGISIKKVADLIDEVAAAASEQYQGTTQINSGVAQVTSSMSQVEQASQHNASLIEETAQAAEELSSQARALKQLVSFFSLSGGGRHHAALAGGGASHDGFEDEVEPEGLKIAYKGGQTKAATSAREDFSDF